MRPRVQRAGAAVAVVAAGAASLAPSGALAQAGVDVTSAVRPIIVDGAILPINLRESILPLEDVKTQGTRTKVTLSADVLFAFNKAKLTPSARRAVKRVADRLDGATGTVRVDGYTDSVGSDAYNRGLSQRRARAVVAALRKSASSSTRFSARGHGESSPIAPNQSGGKDDPQGRAKNRRVTVTYGRR